MLTDDLKNIQEDVYKCSKCGLCQSVCPLYLATKNEMFLSRGRYIVLNNFFNNKKFFGKKFLKQLDICLNCNLCKNFCPSDIDASFVNVYLKNVLNYKYRAFNFSFFYKMYLFLYRIFSFRYYRVNVRRNKSNLPVIKARIVYFEGCYNRYINPSDKNASLNLLERIGYHTDKVISLCCGYPYLQEGNLKIFKKNALKINKQIPNDVSYIVTSCDNCHEMLKKVLDDRFKSKLIRLDELLKINSYDLSFNSNSLYFKPLVRCDEVYLFPGSKTLYKKGICSLMENFFILKYKKLAKKILKETFVSKAEIDNKTSYTSCLLSKWGLEKEVKMIKSSARVLTYAEYMELSN